MRKLFETLAIILLVAVIYCGLASFSRADTQFWKERKPGLKENILPVSYYPYGPVTAARQILILLNSHSTCDVERGARALGSFRGDVAPEILTLCKRGDYGLPGPILTFIADYCGSKGMEFVHSVLRDGDRESSIRAKAAFALGRKRYFKALPDLLRACRYGDWILRCSASRAIGIIGEKRTRPLLHKLFNRENDNRVLPEMAMALYRLDNHSGIPWLISAYKDRKCKGLPGLDAKQKLIEVASEWPRYKGLQKLSSHRQERLLENWIYEWEHGSLPQLVQSL